MKRNLKPLSAMKRYHDSHEDKHGLQEPLDGAHLGGRIFWFAYDVAQSAPQDDNSANAEQPTDGSGAPISADDAKKVADALNGF